jgi:hypothetical protein
MLRAYQDLASLLGRGEEILAVWQLAESRDERQYRVREWMDFAFVLGGVVRNHCTELQFFGARRQDPEPGFWADPKELFGEPAT